MSLVAATVFALGVAGPAVAQTPATPAPTPAPATPAQPAAPAKGGDMKSGGTKMDKMDKKAGKQHGKKKHTAKKAEGDMKTAPETKAPEVKK
jgi:hypothetical protein